MQISRAILIALAAGACVSAAGAAGAQQASPSARTAGEDRAAHQRAGEARGVLICKSDVASRRAFIRRYGERPVFITAREALQVRRGAAAWTAPRCMTEREHARYQDAAGALARAG